MPEDCKRFCLDNVWRACNKIKASVFRTGVDLWDLFRGLDPNGTYVISEQKFLHIFNVKLKSLFGLSDQEICELVDYFKLQDGKVHYGQFCHVIQDDNIPEYKPYTTGLEWDDPRNINLLCSSDERWIKLILTKIAVTLKDRSLVLRPYFQDYELLSNNEGTVTLSHFGRILNFLKIHLSPEEFYLLKKKYLVYGYQVNYLAFLADLNKIIQEFRQKGVLDVGGDIVPIIPGRVLSTVLPKMPYTDIDKTTLERFDFFHPVLKKQIPIGTECELVSRISNFIVQEGIRIESFFLDYDKLNCGNVSEAVFRRCLDVVSIGTYGLNKRLYISPREMDLIVNRYKNPNDEAQIMWRVFIKEVGYPYSGLQKMPDVEVQYPLPQGPKIHKPIMIGETELERVKNKIMLRKIGCLLNQFLDFDRHRCGFVTRRQFRTVLKDVGISLNYDELHRLEQRYYDPIMEVDYRKFLKEVDPPEENLNLYKNFEQKALKLNYRKLNDKPDDKEKNIKEIMKKINNKMACFRINIIGFLAQHDVVNKQLISANDFKRSLDIKLGLTKAELETLANYYRSKDNQMYVEYKRFCSDLDSATSLKEQEKIPMIDCHSYIPTYDGEHNFLNFEDRQIVSKALHKLAVCDCSTLLDFFKDMDKTKLGFIPEFGLLRGLTFLNLHTLLSSNELAALNKCFNGLRNKERTFLYNDFLHALEVVRRLLQTQPL